MNRIPAEHEIRSGRGCAINNDGALDILRLPESQRTSQIRAPGFSLK